MPTKTSEFFSNAKAKLVFSHVRTFAAGGIPPEVNNSNTDYSETQAFGNWFSGQEQPDWKNLIRNHVEATTLANGRKWELVRQTPANARIVVRQQSKVSPFFPLDIDIYSLSGVLPGLYPKRYATPQSMKDDVHGEHVRKAIAKIDAIRGSLSSGEDVGEFTQTVRLLANPFSSLRKQLVDYIESLAKFKRARLRPKEFMKAATDSYLAYNFGVRPLESTISHIVTELSRQGARFSYVPFEVTTTRSTDATGEETLLSPGGSNMTIAYSSRSHSEYTERWKGEIKSCADPEGKLTDYQMLGLTPDKWLPTLYNLIPYSFVLDYVVNVGDIVNALSFRTSDIAWCCVTTRQTTRTIHAASTVASHIQPYDDLVKNIAVASEGQGGLQEYEVVEFYRDRLRKTDFFVPVSVAIPQAWTKPWTNVAAILNSSFRLRNQSY